MLSDYVREYYIDKDFNCAESMLRCINDACHLGMNNEQFKLISGFGAGLGCGSVCGALCACISALGKLLVDERAHNTPGFADKCKGFVEAFRASLGDTMCAELVEKYRNDDERCLETIRKAADVFECYYAKLQAEKMQAQ